MIPTNDKVTIKRATGLDSWGEPVAGQSIEYNCRYSSKSEVVTNQEGEEITTNASFLIKGLASVDYDDVVYFVKPDGNIIEKQPEKINFLRDLSGKVKFTKVVV